ncbi:TlpA disulfide reductase family protein [Pedobacter psychrodurus]|uniref:TlpA family protein disulfide reductase n=1 Tax=Pedobacter psychrodurus TaxID=2530456 RepID=UPI00292F178D|nr:TlpA disulfide reductase family protein [Pedobacter psychrodurus]
MKKTIFFIAVAVLCLFFRGFGQSGGGVSGSYGTAAIRIGEKVPDLLFVHVLNGDKRPVSLSSFKGKAVILDFWGTWCGSCISSFPKMEKLQEKYGRYLQILFVDDSTVDSLENTSAFVELHERAGEVFSIPMIWDKGFTPVLFPHQSYPHYVWIGADRRVAAITDGTHFTEANFERFFAGLELNLKRKEF